MHPMLNATTVDITASNRDHATDAPNTATATTTGPQPRPCNDQRQHQKHAVTSKEVPRAAALTNVDAGDIHTVDTYSA